VVDERTLSSDPALAVFPARLRPTPDALSLPLPPDARRPTIAQRLPLIVGLGLVALAIVGTIYLSTLRWTGTERSPVALGILRTQIIGGTAQVLVYVLAAASVVFLLARRPTRRRAIVGAIAVVAGAGIGAGILFFIAVTNALGVALSATTSAWVIAGFAGTALAVASFWSARRWRTIGVAISTILILIAGTLGVNADFGLDPTVGALVGVSTLNTISLPVTKSTPDPIPTELDGGALWANWAAPADMPTVGTQTQVVLPNTVSGFKARPAGLYLPPAALVKNPPELPFMIMMMGQPGNPDPAITAAILNVFASRNHGLAPIMLVVDQIGNLGVDPLCLNTSEYGNAESYVTQDAVNWARTHLHILQDPAHWTVAGYSNGGECALYFGAKYPSIFGNVLDISGEAYPGEDRAPATLATVFHGNETAYRATWPQTILASGNYPNSEGIFTVSSNDLQYLPEAKAATTAALAAHWKTTFFEVPNGGHVLLALNAGFTEGCEVLYPRLGLSQPPGTATPTSTPSP